MRERLALYASVATLVMAVSLSPTVRAQQETRGAAGDQKSGAHMNKTLHGVVAGITAEGEVFYNHQTNAAVRAEGAFLTVVGSPIHSEANDKEQRSATAGNERHAAVGGRRHNVYIVWLTPQTKVCETARETGTSENAKTSEHAKKECTLDKVEVGDHVEVQFIPEEDSAAHNNIHLSQQMRQKHGRHRTHVGYATAITIMPPREHAQAGSESGTKSNDGSK
jgi:hypothetical protein